MTQIRTLLGGLVVLALVGSLLVSVPVSADVRGRPNIDVYASENRFAPGADATLSLVLLNDATITEASKRDPSLNDVVTTATGVEVDVGAGNAPVTVKTGPRAVGNVPEGATPPVDFRIVVDDDAAPGRYQVVVEVGYTYTRFIDESEENPVDAQQPGRRFETGEYERFTVPIVVEDRARFDVVDVDADVAVGTSGTLTVGVRNTGSDLARDAVVTLQSENPAVTLGGSGPTATSYAGVWESDETRTFRFRVAVDPDAVVREYAVTTTVAYEDRDGLDRSAEPVSFGLRPAVEQGFAIRDVTDTLRVGEEGLLTGTVVNVQGDRVRNAVIELQTAGPTLTASETAYALGDLAPGEERPFAFDLELSDAAEDGQRQLTFAVVHRGSDGRALRSDPLDVGVTVAPERAVFAVAPADDSFRAGRSGSISVTVRNEGDETVTDVSAKLFADDPISTDDDEAFVDSLAPGETTTVTFGVSVAGDALAKTYPLSVDFQYDDADGDTELSDTYRVPVDVVPGRGGGVLPFSLDDGDLGLLLTGLLMVVVGVVVVRYVRRR